VSAKPRIAVIGPGRLGTALIRELLQAGYRIPEVICRNAKSSQRKARGLAKAAGGRLATIKHARLDAGIVWLCVPDRGIASAARAMAGTADWEGKVVFHCSGALASDELDALRRRGAAVASVHPMMTFVRDSIPALRGVPFGVEGDAAAVRCARRIVRDLGGTSFMVRKERKAAYHAWGTFLSPLLLAALVTAEQAARAAGISTAKARRYMLPIVEQTLANYRKLGPAGAFSGPLVRGDVAVIRKHLRVLAKIPAATGVYVALAQAAWHYLPVRNRKALQVVLEQ
jgi:predicted short-subunit dehydrogenase-like oxidoreductase (DUF2520 family)